MSLTLTARKSCLYEKLPQLSKVGRGKENLLSGVSERLMCEQGWMWSLHENMSAVKQCLSILPGGTADSPDTHSEREKEGENRDKRITGTVGTHA